jgi:hypothetical protein
MSVSRHRLSPPAGLPARPLVISVDGTAAGVAIQGGRQFRFFSSHPRFDLLEGSRFSRIEDLHGAVRRLASAAAELAAPAIRRSVPDVLIV